MPFRAKYHPIAQFINCSTSLVLGAITTYFVLYLLSLFLSIIPFNPDVLNWITVILILGSIIWIPVTGFWITRQLSILKHVNQFIYRGLGIGQSGLITYDPDHFGGKPYLRNTTITVEHVLDLLALGSPVQAIVDKYPGITKEQVMACLRWRK